MDILLTLICVTALCLIATYAVFESLGEAYDYLTKKENRKILSGIVTAIVSFVVVIFVFNSSKAHSDVPGKFFSYADVYFGLESPVRQSPQCIDDGPNDRVTSNIGAYLNLYQSESKRLNVDAVYRHHSCAFNTDRNIYDAFGVSVKYRLFQR